MTPFVTSYHPPPTGDHKGPPCLPSSAIAWPGHVKGIPSTGGHKGPNPARLLSRPYARPVALPLSLFPSSLVDGCWVLYCDIVPGQFQVRERGGGRCGGGDYLYVVLFYGLTTLVGDVVIGDQGIEIIEGSEASQVDSTDLATIHT